MVITEFKVTWQTISEWLKGGVYSTIFTNLEEVRAFKKDEENIKENYNVKLLSRTIVEIEID
ncbi:hypothetical protein QGW_3021 [Clostridioides difficile 824]|uniref:hypothetical protein n=1 Tax=Clostridioides difficile TaxID=1496 RepID=UPI00038CF9FA|nr:hypothetical protein [Clostridioides difficile]HDN2469757.1 hypothetical protein [Clostridioides difficile CD196]EGT3891272.1 hypothetical protein [Clostridioides difficile]EGT3903109.1 hypothetical protein [Clostridioides difficile]EGT3919637.1 hypothetical protein [Clostridioides difficile]EGT4171469.1 hypothetical protein [Clostridioides difficile]